MASTSLAGSRHQSSPNNRVERGRELYRHHAQDFVCRDGVWLITSDTVPGRVYEVDVARETCECSDFQIRNVACKHLTAAALAHAKSSPCSCCGSRVLNRFLDEVVEEDELLGWFPGDMICAGCVRAGYWA